MVQYGERKQADRSLRVAGAPSNSSEGSTDESISSSTNEGIRKFVLWFIKFVARAYHTARVLKRRRMKLRFERSKERSRRRFDDGVTESEFCSAYLMSPAKFEKLTEILQPYLGEKLHENNRKGREKAGCSVVRLREKIALSLRILAGASHQDIARVFNTSKATLYSIFGDFIEVVSSGCIPELRIEFPFDDDRKLKKIADDFLQATSNHPALYGCVGALDGYAIKIRRPSLHEVANPLDYVNRKGFFALNMQAICDSRCLFSYISIETPGSTHDASAFALSSFSERWGAHCGSKPWYIAADAAYPVSENLVTPWQGRNLDPFKDAFNFHFSGGNRN